MDSELLQQYLRYYLPCLNKALQAAVGQPPEVVRDKDLFLRTVADPGWGFLPLPLRKAGREKVRWDEFLLAARKEVFLVMEGTVGLRGDAEARLRALAEAMFGEAPATVVPIIPVVEPVANSAPAGIPMAVPVASAPPVNPAAIPMARLVEAPPSSPPAPARPPAAAPQPRPAEHEVAVGIDLGTTYSVVAHLDAYGRPVSIPNAAGDILTPSIVLLDEGGPVVGKEAVQAGALEPDKVAAVIKRDMGSKLYHKKVNGEFLPPEVLSALILRSVKADAERKLGPVRKAVITVPAYFDESRRRATVDAGRLAGLEVLDIINEPTAAAIAYGYQVGFLDPTGRARADKPLRVLVYDLGGGTFDVTIVEIQGASFKALATDGDVALGGKDWDEWLVGYAAEDFIKHHREDPRAHPATEHEMWVAAEAAKKTLTERPRAALFVSHLGIRHKVEVTRQQFEEATAALLGRTRTTAEIVVRQSGLRWQDIDKVLLVGGSTRMPMVVRMLEELAGRPPERSVSPDEAVAHGAALFADLLLRQHERGRAPFTVTNVNSHSLGIIGVDPQTGRKRNQILIPKNTPLPHTRSAAFKTHRASQPNVAIRVVEGESERPEACIQIGVFTVNLPPNLPAGWPVQVSYSYASNGRLEVRAKVKDQPDVSTSFQRENSISEEEIQMWTAYFNELVAAG